MAATVTAGKDRHQYGDAVMGSISGGFEYNRQNHEQNRAAMLQELAEKQAREAAAMAELAKVRAAEQALDDEYGPRPILRGPTWADRHAAQRAVLPASMLRQPKPKGMLETAFGGLFSRWKQAS